MAGRINDRELITLARTNKTPKLQATLQLKCFSLWLFKLIYHALVP